MSQNVIFTWTNLMRCKLNNVSLLCFLSYDTYFWHQNVFTCCLLVQMFVWCVSLWCSVYVKCFMHLWDCVDFRTGIIDRIQFGWCNAIKIILIGRQQKELSWFQKGRLAGKRSFFDFFLRFIIFLHFLNRCKSLGVKIN